MAGDPVSYAPPSVAPQPNVINVLSRNALGVACAAVATAKPASAAFTGQTIYAFPFTLSQPFDIAYWWTLDCTGAAGTNFIVIYSDTYQQLANLSINITNSATAGRINSSPDTTNLILGPGKYYCGVYVNALSAASANLMGVTAASAGFWAAHGCWLQSGLNNTVPVTATPALYTTTVFPIGGISSVVI